MTITVFTMDQAYELVEKFESKFDYYEITNEGMMITVTMYNK